MNPVQTGYSAVADEWIGIRPGTDGLFVLSLVHELLQADRIDLDFLARYTNAAWLVVQNPGGADDGLVRARCGGKAAGLGPRQRRRDRRRDAGHAAADRRRIRAARRPPRACRCSSCWRSAIWTAATPGRRWRKPAASPPRPSAASPARSPTSAFDQAIELDQPWTDTSGRRHEKMLGRPVAMHAMRGISAHSNGFHTCRAIHLLQMLLGAVDTPGVVALQVALPEADPAGPQPAGKGSKPNTMLPGMALGNPRGPEDLLIEDDGTPVRIDKAFTWEAPMSAHGLMHTMIANAHAGDPYKIDTLFMYMANMAWNSSMNPGEAARMMADKDPATAATASRTSSIPTRSIPRRSPMPTWCCPTPPIWSAGTAFRCWTGRSAVRRGRPTRSASRCCRRIATCARSRTC